MPLRPPDAYIRNGNSGLEKKKLVVARHLLSAADKMLQAEFADTDPKTFIMGREYWSPRIEYVVPKDLTMQAMGAVLGVRARRGTRDRFHVTRANLYSWAVSAGLNAHRLAPPYIPALMTTTPEGTLDVTSSLELEHMSSEDWNQFLNDASQTITLVTNAIPKPVPVQPQLNFRV